MVVRRRHFVGSGGFFGDGDREAASHRAAITMECGC